MPRPLREDLPSLKASAARKAGLITTFMDEAVIEIGGHKAKVGLWHMFFPNDGSWSYFVCPTCGRRCQTLRLHDGRFGCASCIKFGASKRPDVIERLRAELGRPMVHNRKKPEWALRRALIAERKKRLKGWPPKPSPSPKR